MLLGPVELHQHPPASRHDRVPRRAALLLGGWGELSRRLCLREGFSEQDAREQEGARERGREGDGRHGWSAQGAPRRPLLPSRRDRGGIGRAVPRTGLRIRCPGLQLKEVVCSLGFHIEQLATLHLNV
ncbi:hypothetical protein PVAP13_5NG484730 [Panicum virgatum]|uniref:Uncharacterized protein n=1 Tax=Panicum virgatum TaxID=38727 RepID=A0A8T0S3W7_PANVG|nr:hypothetical protein PVAP13_5NG484730 [Panicum virgatum]